MAEHKRAGFVHLRVKSAYSLLEGAIRSDELAELTRDGGMPAVAVTAANNLFGVYDISAALANALATRRKPPSLALLVQNEAGYQNLTKLLSAAYLDAEPGDWPHVKAAMLTKHADGLIALTGGPGGPINRLLVDGQPAAASQMRDRLTAMFPDRLYVELQRHGLAEE